MAGNRILGRNIGTFSSQANSKTLAKKLNYNISREKKIAVSKTSSHLAHLNLFPRLKVSGVVPLRRLYAFVAITGTTLPYCVIVLLNPRVITRI
jgi:hypothetical protein